MTTAQPTVRVVQTTTHGRYLLGTSPQTGRCPCLIGFHGYAESAERHFEQLTQIPGSASWRVVAIQALHRFYNNKTREVIASWMTKQDRELAIRDNLDYINRVVEELGNDDQQVTPLVYIGYSQGVAMAYRAAAAAGRSVEGVIVLAGDVPPELKTQSSLNLPPVLLGRGIADTWYSAEKMDEDLRFFERNGVETETCVFDGGHEWSPQFKESAGRFLQRVLARSG